MILEENPKAGLPVEDLLDFRELTLTFGSGEYIIRYREYGQQIVVVRVRHNKEDLF